MSVLMTEEQTAARSNTSARMARTVIFAFCLATAAEGIYLGGILPVIPATARLYQIGSGDAFWINAIFLLSVGVTCPALSRLGDLYGHKKLTILTLIISIAGIGLDVVAPNYSLFLVGRFMLGMSPAITPLAIGVFRNSLDEESTLYGIGAISAAMTLGHAVGPVFAGYVFDGTGSIGWVFASWIVLLVPSVIAVALLVPESPPPLVRRSMDWLGATTLGLGVAATLFAFAYAPKVGWTSPSVLVALTLSVVLLASWYGVERRSSSPLVNLAMLRNSEATPYYISSFLWGAAYYGALTTVVLFLVASREKLGFGFSVSVVELGWLLMPQNISMIVGALLVAKIVKSFGGYRVAGVLGGIMLGLGFLGMMTVNGSLWLFMPFVIMTGFGSGLLQTTLSGRVSEVCLPDERGISAGMYQTFKNIGGSMAGAFASAVFAALVVDGTNSASVRAYLVVFGACLLASIVIIPVLLASRRRNGVAITP